MRKIKETFTNVLRYLKTILFLAFLAVLTGILSGLVGTAFHKSIDIAARCFGGADWLLYLLPLGGLAIVGIYRLCRLPFSTGTNEILDSVHTSQRPPYTLLPAIFSSTVITHLLGGSAGREGAALQLGGVIGRCTGHFFHLKEEDRRMIILCGMSGVFSALFGTPLTATLFAMEVTFVGTLYSSAFVPCLTSSMSAYGIARLLGVQPTRMSFPVLPDPGFGTIGLFLVLCVLCAFLSVVFCVCMHKGHTLFSRIIPNDFLRIFAGGACVVLLSLLLGTRDYNGSGMSVIEKAVSGTARPEAFALKLLFTVITIGCGYRGGEIVPTFFVGATFGCVMGTLLGLPAGFCAAIGLIGTFCGVVNCPLSSIFMAVELFGGQGVPWFFAACCICYAFSGYSSLYSSQHFVFSKLHLEDVDLFKH